ncbi:prohead protease/major capsid protein fusion protein [Methylobacterium sp. SI9]|uniref:prohead protease/major capsid protein fusion protein n=1 Tax=Methylobacterium guangdongense TaxID=3138811 RepID=UPI00313B127D
MSARHLVTRRAPLPAASFNREARTFTAIAATSAPIPRFDWGSGDTVNEVLVIDASAVDLTRLNSGRAPILNGHRQNAAADQIGVIRAARIEAGQLVIDGELSTRADVAAIADDIAAGIIANVSVGYAPEARERIPGQRGQPDTMRITRWTPAEVSIVPIPADPGAYVRSGVSIVDPEENEGGSAVVTPPPAQTRSASSDTRNERQRVSSLTDIARRANIPAVELDAAIEDGTSVAAFRTRAFDALATRSEAHRTSNAGSAHLPDTDPTYGVAGAIQGAIYARMTGKPPEGRAREYMGRSLLEMGTALLEARGERVRWTDRDDLAGQIIGRSGGMHTTSDFPTLLSSSANRVLTEAYEAAGTPLKLLARRRTRTDFKAVTDVHLSEAPRLLKVGEKGEIKHGSRAEEGRPLYAMATYARLFGLSRTALINDDLNAFADSLGAFGQGAAQTENDELVKLFTANTGSGVTMYDGSPVYNVGHGNVATGTDVGPLSVASLGLGRQALRQMKGLDGITPINATAKNLVVGPALETQAEQVLTQLNATQVQDANPFPGKLQLHVEPRFTDSAWRLFADPGVMPCIEIAYLAGREGPQLTFREGWDVLGVEFRAVLDFGCGVREWRGTYMNPGR